MKIDLHVHTRERSNCARVGEEDQIRAAIKAGLDGLAITDHNLLVPPMRLAELREKYAPFKLFTGIEVDADDEHWLVLGLSDPALQVQGWTYPALHHFVRKHDGFIALAHPFRYRPRLHVDLESCPPDALEVHSLNTPTSHEEDIRRLAARLGAGLLENSDAHGDGQVGRYHNWLPGPVDTDAQLLTRLRELRNQN